MTHDLGIWLDDPPSVVLRPRYLDTLRQLPIQHLAVMADGPAPGLHDARWTTADLARLRAALRSRRLILTAWAAAHAKSTAELGQRLPALVDALEADGVEVDVEPVGDWSEGDVRGFEDIDRDGSRLDEASDALAAVLVSLPVPEIETTVFPGALRHVIPLLEALVATGTPKTLRLWLQVYAVATRSGTPIAWNGKLGPMRFPREALADARARVPSDVEVCAGLAAYRTTWAEHGDSMTVAAQSALMDGGPRRLRWWSGKWLTRLPGHEGRRARLEQVVHALERDRPTAPAPAPTVLEELVADLEAVASRAKAAGFPLLASEIARLAAVGAKG
ncbi:MAG: hypothetical protein RLP09_41705 [Sandaracinaceae bacterium]